MSYRYQADSLVFNTDSYAYSHPGMLDPSIEFMRTAGGNRSTRMFPGTMWFGTQGYLKSELMIPVTTGEVEEMAEMASLHGEPFDFDGWMRIVHVHGGLPPVSIRAVPEGTYISGNDTLYTMVNTDEQLSPLIQSHIETSLVRASWYMSSVATVAFFAKRLILKHLRETSSADEKTLMEQILPFMLNDFGARGATSQESAARGGAAHLLMFKGTDNMAAIRWLRKFYQEPMAGFSIAATNHMIMSSQGREGEAAVTRRVFDVLKERKIMAIVADTYNLWDHGRNILAPLRPEMEELGVRIVSRPDSGEPREILPAYIDLLADEAVFGATTNDKGYKVLNPVIRTIQGDGVSNLQAMEEILMAVREAGYAVENTCFGMGAGLLQDRMRDDQGFAQKATQAYTKEKGWYGVYKDPITSNGSKTSRTGNLAVYKRPDGTVETVDLTGASRQEGERLDREVYRDGRLIVDEPLSVMRQRADSYL